MAVAQAQMFRQRKIDFEKCTLRNYVIKSFLIHYSFVNRLVFERVLMQ